MRHLWLTQAGGRMCMHSLQKFTRVHTCFFLGNIEMSDRAFSSLFSWLDALIYRIRRRGGSCSCATLCTWATPMLSARCWCGCTQTDWNPASVMWRPSRGLQRDAGCQAWGMQLKTSSVRWNTTSRQSGGRNSPEGDQVLLIHYLLVDLLWF